MAKDVKEQSNQLNLAVVALVALVAIVGLVALVLNAGSLASMATGMGQASAEQLDEAAAVNLAGGASCWAKISDAYYKMGLTVSDIPDLKRVYC